MQVAREMSGSSVVSGASSSHLHASSKSWSLTLNPESKDVFVWKSGARLKLKDGQSAGRVREANVLDSKETIVTVSFIVHF